MRLPARLVTFGAVLVCLVSAASCGGSSATPTPSPTPAPAAASAAAALPTLGLPVTLPSGLGLPGGGALGGTPDASTVVTADMAASVIGGSPQKIALPGVAGGVAGGVLSVVSYMTTEGGHMTVVVEKVPGGIAQAALQAAIQSAGAKGDLQLVGGIGDAAGKVVDANDATLAFAKGDFIVAMNAQSATAAGTDLESKLEAVAHQVVGKL